MSWLRCAKTGGRRSILIAILLALSALCLAASLKLVSSSSPYQRGGGFEGFSLSFSSGLSSLSSSSGGSISESSSSVGNGVAEIPTEHPALHALFGDVTLIDALPLPPPSSPTSPSSYLHDVKGAPFFPSRHESLGISDRHGQAGESSSSSIRFQTDMTYHLYDYMDYLQPSNGAAKASHHSEKDQSDEALGTSLSSSFTTSSTAVTRRPIEVFLTRLGAQQKHHHEQTKRKQQQEQEEGGQQRDRSAPTATIHSKKCDGRSSLLVDQQEEGEQKIARLEALGAHLARQHQETLLLQSPAEVTINSIVTSNSSNSSGGGSNTTPVDGSAATLSSLSLSPSSSAVSHSDSGGDCQLPSSVGGSATSMRYRRALEHVAGWLPLFDDQFGASGSNALCLRTTTTNKSAMIGHPSDEGRHQKKQSTVDDPRHDGDEVIHHFDARITHSDFTVTPMPLFEPSLHKHERLRTLLQMHLLQTTAESADGGTQQTTQQKPRQPSKISAPRGGGEGPRADSSSTIRSLWRSLPIDDPLEHDIHVGSTLDFYAKLTRQVTAHRRQLLAENVTSEWERETMTAPFNEEGEGDDNNNHHPDHQEGGGGGLRGDQDKKDNVDGVKNTIAKQRMVQNRTIERRKVVRNPEVLLNREVPLNLHVTLPSLRNRLRVWLRDLFLFSRQPLMTFRHALSGLMTIASSSSSSPVSSLGAHVRKTQAFRRFFSSSKSSDFSSKSANHDNNNTASVSMAILYTEALESYFQKQPQQQKQQQTSNMASINEIKTNTNTTRSFEQLLDHVSARLFSSPATSGGGGGSGILRIPSPDQLFDAAKVDLLFQLLVNKTSSRHIPGAMAAAMEPAYPQQQHQHQPQVHQQTPSSSTGAGRLLPTPPPPPPPTPPRSRYELVVIDNIFAHHSGSSANRQKGTTTNDRKAPHNIGHEGGDASTTNTPIISSSLVNQSEQLPVDGSPSPSPSPSSSPSLAGRLLHRLTTTVRTTTYHRSSSSSSKETIIDDNKVIKSTTTSPNRDRGTPHVWLTDTAVVIHGDVRRAAETSADLSIHHHLVRTINTHVTERHTRRRGRSGQEEGQPPHPVERPHQPSAAVHLLPDVLFSTSMMHDDAVDGDASADNNTNTHQYPSSSDPKSSSTPTSTSSHRRAVYGRRLATLMQGFCFGRRAIPPVGLEVQEHSSSSSSSSRGENPNEHTSDFDPLFVVTQTSSSSGYLPSSRLQVVQVQAPLLCRAFLLIDRIGNQKRHAVRISREQDANHPSALSTHHGDVVAGGEGAPPPPLVASPIAPPPTPPSPFLELDNSTTTTGSSTSSGSSSTVRSDPLGDALLEEVLARRRQPAATTAPASSAPTKPASSNRQTQKTPAEKMRAEALKAWYIEVFGREFSAMWLPAVHSLGAGSVSESERESGGAEDDASLNHTAPSPLCANDEDRADTSASSVSALLKDLLAAVFSPFNTNNNNNVVPQRDRPNEGAAEGKAGRDQKGHQKGSRSFSSNMEDHRQHTTPPITFQYPTFARTRSRTEQRGQQQQQIPPSSRSSLPPLQSVPESAGGGVVTDQLVDVAATPSTRRNDGDETQPQEEQEERQEEQPLRHEDDAADAMDGRALEGGDGGSSEEYASHRDDDSSNTSRADDGTQNGDTSSSSSGNISDSSSSDDPPNNVSSIPAATTTTAAPRGENPSTKSTLPPTPIIHSTASSHRPPPNTKMKKILYADYAAFAADVLAVTEAMMAVLDPALEPLTVMTRAHASDLLRLEKERQQEHQQQQHQHQNGNGNEEGVGGSMVSSSSKLAVAIPNAANPPLSVDRRWLETSVARGVESVKALTARLTLLKKVAAVAGRLEDLLRYQTGHHHQHKQSQDCLSKNPTLLSSPSPPALASSSSSSSSSATAATAMGRAVFGQGYVEYATEKDFSLNGGLPGHARGAGALIPRNHYYALYALLDAERARGELLRLHHRTLRDQHRHRRHRHSAGKGEEGSTISSSSSTPPPFTLVASALSSGPESSGSRLSFSSSFSSSFSFSSVRYRHVVVIRTDVFIRLPYYPIDRLFRAAVLEPTFTEYLHTPHHLHDKSNNIDNNNNPHSSSSSSSGVKTSGARSPSSPFPLLLAAQRDGLRVLTAAADCNHSTSTWTFAATRALHAQPLLINGEQTVAFHSDTSYEWEQLTPHEQQQVHTPNHQIKKNSQRSSSALLRRLAQSRDLSCHVPYAQKDYSGLSDFFWLCGRSAAVASLSFQTLASSVAIPRGSSAVPLVHVHSVPTASATTSGSSSSYPAPSPFIAIGKSFMDCGDADATGFIATEPLPPWRDRDSASSQDTTAAVKSDSSSSRSISRTSRTPLDRFADASARSTKVHGGGSPPRPSTPLVSDFAHEDWKALFVAEQQQQQTRQRKQEKRHHQEVRRTIQKDGDEESLWLLSGRSNVKAVRLAVDDISVKTVTTSVTSADFDDTTNGRDTNNKIKNNNNNNGKRGSSRSNKNHHNNNPATTVGTRTTIITTTAALTDVRRILTLRPVVATHDEGTFSNPESRLLFQLRGAGVRVFRHPPLHYVACTADTATSLTICKRSEANEGRKIESRTSLRVARFMAMVFTEPHTPRIISPFRPSVRHVDQAHGDAHEPPPPIPSSLSSGGAAASSQPPPTHFLSILPNIRFKNPNAFKRRKKRPVVSSMIKGTNTAAADILMDCRIGWASALSTRFGAAVPVGATDTAAHLNNHSDGAVDDSQPPVLQQRQRHQQNQPHTTYWEPYYLGKLFDRSLLFTRPGPLPLPPQNTNNYAKAKRGEEDTTPRRDNHKSMLLHHHFRNATPFVAAAPTPGNTSRKSVADDALAAAVANNNYYDDAFRPYPFRIEYPPAIDMTFPPLPHNTYTTEPRERYVRFNIIRIRKQSPLSGGGTGGVAVIRKKKAVYKRK